MRQHDENNDRELWRLAREDWRGAQVSPDPAEAHQLVAAYLDGALDTDLRDKVEAWLAADSEALDLLLTAQAARATPPASPPATLLSRAQGLVRDQKVARPGLFAQIGSWLVPSGPLWQPIGLAMAFAIVCAAGFELGRAGYASALSPDRPGVQQVADLGFDSTFDDIF